MRDDDAVSRRDLMLLSGGVLLAGAAMAACSKREAPPARAASSKVVRVCSVPTAVEGDLLPALFEMFRKGGSPLATPISGAAEQAYQVELTSSDDVYALARAGKVDLAISHYGHRDAESFVMGGFGEWPRTLFSNQMALLGPPEDPAQVRGLEDAGEAFRRIAATKSLLVVNHIEGVRYLIEVLWNAAGRPDRTGWLLDEGRHKEDAIRVAAERSAYSFWGLTPFLRLRRETPLRLEPLVVGDPLLHRMLVAIVVKPAVGHDVNAEGARALQSFLLSPATQAHIREVRYPGADAVLWVPGARHNRTAILPMT